MALRTAEVFGLNTKISEYSYIDRGSLDAEIIKLNSRNQHISLKGESKSGKSWLRQKNFPDALVVQCRIGFNPIDIFVSILGLLGIELRQSTTTRVGGGLEFSGSGKGGWELLAKAEIAISGSGQAERSIQKIPIGKDANDLQFICEIIKASGRKVVIEDFHYLTTQAQRELAHDLKAMWDYSVYVVIVGVWVRRNYLTYLNPDLAGRITEVNVYWQDHELYEVINKGAQALNITIDTRLATKIVSDSFGNVGLLQTLALGTLDHAGINERSFWNRNCDSNESYEEAALLYAEQLEAVYLEFARRVSQGIRKRKGATKIYAHAMWAVFDSTAAELISGVPIDTIYDRAYARQPRIQKGNLKSIMEKLDGLQIDDRGKGLVVTYVEQSGSVSVVDRTVLFYRKYCTVEWPWKDIIETVEEEGLGSDRD